MKKILPILLVGLGAALGSCQRPSETVGSPATTDSSETVGSLDTTPPVNATDSVTTVGMPGGAATEEAALLAVRRHVQQLPNRAVYQPDSAQAVDAGGQYQVLVPRTDWAGRMPNKAAFNVDKQTGTVTVQPVK